MDDLIVLATTLEKMDVTKQTLAERFKMKDLGDIHYCLGISMYSLWWRSMDRQRPTQSADSGRMLFPSDNAKLFSLPSDEPHKVWSNTYLATAPTACAMSGRVATAVYSKLPTIDW